MQPTIPSSISIQDDVYNAKHIRIITTIDNSLLLQYLNEICLQSIEHNNQGLPEIKAIWVHLEGESLTHLGSLCKAGFEIHHGFGEKIAVYKWILKRACLIPPFSVFYVGCGAIVVNKDRILLVQEKSGTRKNLFGVPGGRANPGETINLCAVRELKEELNLKGTFRSILQFREMSYSVFDCVDVYFACLVDVPESELENIKLCEVELISYKWVHLSELIEFGLNHKSSMTQRKLFTYLSELWKSGFDFANDPPITSTFHQEFMGEGKPDKISSYHELIPTNPSLRNKIPPPNPSI